MNKHVIFGIIALLLMVATTYFPTTVNKQSELSAVKFGYPFGFVTQDYSSRKTTFPVAVSFSTQNLESGEIATTLLQFPFFIDIFLYFGFVELIGLGFEKVYEKKA